MNERIAIEDPVRFANAIRRFDEENARDPNRENWKGRLEPSELVYANWLSEWVVRLRPAASEALLLAARSAHLCRWTIARNSFAPGKAGYLKWRQELKAFHAQKAAGILSETGYPAETIERVKGLISKSSFPADPDSRVLEDALCLVFLEHQFADLAARSSEDQILNAIRKTWNKMTPRAQEIAKALPLRSSELRLLEKALNPTTNQHQE